MSKNEVSKKGANFEIYYGRRSTPLTPALSVAVKEEIRAGSISKYPVNLVLTAFLLLLLFLVIALY
jgi:hypothetical protein